jgi:HK97 family phage portal protein
MIATFGLGRAVFPKRDFANFAKEAYQLNVIAYRCIELISSAAASVPWLLYRDEAEIDDHPLLMLLRRPAPMQSGKELWTALYAYDLLTGNGYLERVMVGSGQRVQELYAHRPDRMKVVPGPFGLPSAFEYHVNGQTRPFAVDPASGKSSILHVKRFNPLDDWYGQSPLEAIGMSVDSHNEATKWNYAVLKNGARPSGAMEYQSTMDDTNFNRLKGEIDGMYSGQNRGRPMLLQGGLKWVQMMLSQMEMDWHKGKQTSAAEIAVAYNVPEQLVGVPGQQTYNNYREARLALYEDAVLPLLDRYSEALTNWFQQVPEFESLRIGYDIDQIPALAPRREAMWDKVQNAGFLTIDEKRQALGYEPYLPSEDPGGVIFVSAANLPLTDLSLVSGDGAGMEQGEGGGVVGLGLDTAQIQAVVQIVHEVVNGTLPAESATTLLRLAFPALDEATIAALIKPAEELEPPKPAATAPGEDDEESEDEDDEDETRRRVRRHVIRCLRAQRARVGRSRLDKASRLAYGGK